MNSTNQCHMCHPPSHEHYQDFHPEKLKMENVCEELIVHTLFSFFFTVHTLVEGIVHLKTFFGSQKSQTQIFRWGGM